MVTKAIKTGEAHSRSKVLDVLGFFHAWLLFAGIVPLLACIPKPDLGTWAMVAAYELVLFVPIVVSYYLLRKNVNLFLYILAGFVITVAIAVGGAFYGSAMMQFGGLIDAIPTAFYSMLVFIVRAYSRITQTQLAQDFAAAHEDAENVLLEAWEVDTFLSCPEPVHWVFMTVLYICGTAVGFTRHIYLMFVFLIADIFICFLYNYIDEFHRYIRRNHGHANLPVSMMKKVHKTLMGAALLVLLACMVPALIYGKEPMSGFVNRLQAEQKQGVTPAEMYQDEQTYSTESQGNGLEELVPESTWEPPLWLKTMMNIILYGFVIVIILFILWLLIRRLLEAGRDFGVEESDEVIYLDDVKEKDEDLQEEVRKDGFLTPNAQIRRRYRKAIKKNTKGRPDDSYTPEELENTASMKADEERRTLHEVYEQARYSKEGCGREDLKKLDR